MLKIDPIIAVKDVQISASWYEQLFDLKNSHGGDNFAVLVDENNLAILCLHKWGEHNHPTMMTPDNAVGNGLILYFKTDALMKIRDTAKSLALELVEDIHLNTNSLKHEFSLRDPDGYYLTITEHHNYED